MMLGLFLVAFALGAPPAAPSERPRLLVLDLSASLGAQPGLAKLLGEMVVARLQEIGDYEVLSQTDVNAMLQVEVNRQLTGCGEEHCLAEIGGALGAQYLATGNVSMLGGRAVLTLRLIDTAAARLVKQLTEEMPSGQADFAEAMRVSTYKLLDRPVPPRPVPWYRNPWILGGVGAGVAALTVGGYFLLRPPSAPDASLGTVVLDGN